MHPEHGRNWATFEEMGGSVDWSLLCAGMIWGGEVSLV